MYTLKHEPRLVCVRVWGNVVPYLQSANSCTLETQIRLEILGNFPDKALER